MKKRKKRSRDDELNFWQPASDMFSALLLILMLVILLLGLYLVHIPEHNQVDPWAGDAFVEGSEADAQSTVTPQPTLFAMIPNGGGQGEAGSETPHPTFTVWPPASWSPSPSVSPTPTISPTPDVPGGGGGSGGGLGGGNGQGEGPGDEPDAGLKSAVYVMLVDAETDRTVKEPNVEFELYGSGDALQVLNSYYPERISYRFYETTETGAFYLPEKLVLGEYELHELTEPEGYDASENVAFALTETYDWPEPMVVKVPVYPSRNVIRVQMLDAETNLGVPQGTFDVIAAENIITADGTLRYRAGQTAGEIVCDDTGYGCSEEIYLGRYFVRQRNIPPYYAGILEDIEVEVAKKTSLLPAVNTVSCQRTTINLALKDELNPVQGIAGAVFRLDAVGLEPVEASTDQTGGIRFNALEKGYAYVIEQVQAASDYQPVKESVSFYVSPDGRIDGEPEQTVELTSHIIRVAIGVTDEFSAVQVPNMSLALYDASTDERVRAWTSMASPMVFTNLHEGLYYLIMNGETENRYTFQVYDQAERQEINLTTSYMLHYMMYGAATALAILAIAAAVLLIRKIRNKKMNA